MSGACDVVQLTVTAHAADHSCCQPCNSQRGSWQPQAPVSFRRWSYPGIEVLSTESTPTCFAFLAHVLFFLFLSINYTRSESANQLFDEDDLSKQKNQRMATLLGFSTDPSREALIDELVKKGILAQVSQSARPAGNSIARVATDCPCHPFSSRFIRSAKVSCLTPSPCEPSVIFRFARTWSACNSCRRTLPL